MQLVPLTDIELRSRQRSKIDPIPLRELRDSILSVGLLHPPACWYDESTSKWVLTVGERRYTAIRELAKDNLEFHCGEHRVLPGNIPIMNLGEYLDEVGRFEAELDENIHRSELDWKDRARAFAALHAMRLKQNPEQTALDTGTELARKNSSFTTAESARKAVRQATTIVAHLDNEKVASARNAQEALALIYRSEEEKALAALAKRRLAEVKSADKTLDIRHADALDLLPKLDANSFDLLLVDPPYGIDANSGGFRARTVLHHNYEDTASNARELARTILTEGFRLTKNRANIFIFCDIDLFGWLKTAASNMGWTPFRRPLIWQKSDTEGLAPWGGQGPRITTEFIFYATKGQRGLLASPTDVFNVRRVPRHERIHAAEKPVELLRKLIECSTMPGDSVLDPCCGSGSTLVACKELNRRALGIEKDADYYATAMANVFGDQP